MFIGLLVGFAALAGAIASASNEQRSELPVSPYVILGSTLLDPPRLEAVPLCIPARLSLQLGNFDKGMAAGEFEESKKLLDTYADTVAMQDPAEHERDVALLRAALAARRVRGRDQQLVARAQLEQITKHERKTDRLVCALLESARLDIALRLLPEANAALSRIARLSSGSSDDPLSLERVKFYRAELLYRRKEPFNAHILYRELASSKNPRTAAAARLRLTDLSFDSGKSRSVRLEYETLLPHGAAFGALMADWSLRASEAALDSRDFGAAKTWLDRYGEAVQDRNARDLMEIRRADLDVLEGRPKEARVRLRKLWGRKGNNAIEDLARVRQIDLGVSSASPDARLVTLHAATSNRNRGVQIYALAALVHELVLQGNLDEGIAAITRLAYEGADPVLARHFDRDLDHLLTRSVLEADEDKDCWRLVRRLGGRYGVLLGYTSDISPFLALGVCFERMQLHAMAIELYRSLTRSQGPEVAGDVALPLARASLAVGDVSLARAAAEVNIRHGGDRTLEWKAILAAAEIALQHDETASELLRELLPNNKLKEKVVSLALLFATVVERHKNSDDLKLLERTLHSIADSAREAEPSAFGEAAMLAASRLRGEGRTDRVNAMYTIAARYLPEGARKNEAQYWTTDISSDARPQDAGTESQASGPWSLLAEYEARAESLASRYQLGAVQ